MGRGKRIGRGKERENKEEKDSEIGLGRDR